MYLHSSRDDRDLHKTGAVGPAGCDIRRLAGSSPRHCPGTVIVIATIVVPSLKDIGESALSEAQGEEEMEELHDSDSLTDVKRM